VSIPITLNGDPAEVEPGSTLAALLERLGVEQRRVVVEHNRRILRAGDYEGAVLGAGDEVEIVQLVGGGRGESPGASAPQAQTRPPQDQREVPT
jgi:thiamine biosynthesis protein ThiS